MKKKELTNEELKERSDFTSRKLDWINAIMLDRRLTTAAKVYGIYVAMRINWKTCITFVSDATASDETGIGATTISTSRKKLVKTKWIDLSRRNSGAPYTFRMLHGNVNAMDDIRIANRELCAEARKKRGRNRPEMKGIILPGGYSKSEGVYAEPPQKIA